MTSTQLTQRERQRLREAAEHSYFVNTARRRVHGANAWRNQCERELRPYVRIDVHKRRRATVLVDLLPCGGTFSNETLEKIRALWLAHTMPGSAFSPGQVQVCLFRIPAEDAEYLADQLLRLAEMEGSNGKERDSWKPHYTPARWFREAIGTISRYPSATVLKACCRARG